jgi:hypothetical protein
MQADSDFWLLLVNLAARLQEQGATEVERRERLLETMRTMSPPMREIMTRRTRALASELSELHAAAAAEFR